MKRGFTLIELVMVIVILGILAATALPRFVNLTDQAKLAAVRGGLGGIRAGVAITYASNAAGGNASFPSNVTSAMFADDQVPMGFGDSTAVTTGTGGPSADGTGWRYDPANGRVWINDSDYSTY